MGGPKPEDVNKMKLAFRDLDINRDGMLSLPEITQLLKKGKSDFPDSDVEILFKQVDKDASGKVDFSEFVDYLFAGQHSGKKMTAYEQQVALMMEISDAHMAEVDQVEIFGVDAVRGHQINGIYEIGDELNGHATYSLSYPKNVLFFGWTKNQKKVGWFVARNLPVNSHGFVKKYKMFNPSPYAKMPHLCTGMWEGVKGDRDKRMVCGLVDDSNKWDTSVVTGQCPDEDLWGADDEDDDRDKEQAEGSGTYLAEGSVDDAWLYEWCEEAGEGVVEDHDDDGADKDDAGDDEQVAQPDETPFEDPDFFGDAALGKMKLNGPNGWTRCSEMHSKAKLFEKISPEAVFGAPVASNQWFLSACAVIAEYPAWVQSMFNTCKVTPDGQYKVRLFHPGKNAFQHVTVDDRIPTRDGAPYFAGLSIEGEMWVALLEKAFAKLCKSYANTAGDDVAWGMLYLCGGGEAEMWKKKPSTGAWSRCYTKWNGKANDTIDRNLAEGEVKDGDHIGANQLWVLLRTYMEYCWPVSCNLDPAAAGKQTGLKKDRAYALIGAREVPVNGKTLRMVRLRNPWTPGSWKGRWHDADSLWEKCPAAKNHLQFQPKKDGAFWCSYSQFLEIMVGIDVVKKAMPVQGSRAAKLVGYKRGLEKAGQ